MFRKHSNAEILKATVEKASKLPFGFIIGALIGGGAYFYASKKSDTKKVRAITGLGKLVAPYVIISMLDKFVEIYDKKQVKKKLKDSNLEPEDLLQVEVM